MPRATRKRWQRLVDVLRANGPMTTGALGHVYGIGQNVRGIRIEANAGLARLGRPERIDSKPTYEIVDGRRVRRAWATYRLVNVELVPHLERTDRVIAERRRKVPSSAGAFGPRREQDDPVGQGVLL